MNLDEKNNRIPQVVVDMIAQLENPYATKFQRDIAQTTLERIKAACDEALAKHQMLAPVRKRQ